MRTVGPAWRESRAMFVPRSTPATRETKPMANPQQVTTSRSSQSPQRRGRIDSTRFSPSWTAEMWRFSMSVPFLLGDADIRQLVIRKAERRLRLGELRAAGGKRRLAEDYDLHRNALAGEVDRMRPAICHRGKRSEEHTSELQSLMRISYAVFCLKK